MLLSAYLPYIKSSPILQEEVGSYPRETRGAMKVKWTSNIYFLGMSKERYLVLNFWWRTRTIMILCNALLYRTPPYVLRHITHFPPNIINGDDEYAVSVWKDFHHVVQPEDICRHCLIRSHQTLWRKDSEACLAGARSSARTGGEEQPPTQF